jgi:hypothetical protein
MCNQQELEEFVKKLFNVDLGTFIASIKLSPNAQGYLSGAITEILLKRFLEQEKYELLRIKEKWEGDKHPNHHGDFYIRKEKGKWFVLESKGVKSNSEKWHKLFNKKNLIEFLNIHISKTPFKSKIEIEDYISRELPLFNSKYSTDIYTINEVKKYKFSKKETDKSKAIKELSKLNQEQIEKLINERINYLMKKIRVIETHLVSGGSNKSERTQATPRKDEFNVLSLDLFLRTGKHEFIFANPKLLEPSSKDKNHLQQNYIVGIIIEDSKQKLKIESPWTTDFDSLFSTLRESINEEDMQIDKRGDTTE